MRRWIVRWFVRSRTGRWLATSAIGRWLVALLVARVVRRKLTGWGQTYAGRVIARSNLVRALTRATESVLRQLIRRVLRLLH
jgi:hypothetical protein